MKSVVCDVVLRDKETRSRESEKISAKSFTCLYLIKFSLPLIRKVD